MNAANEALIREWIERVWNQKETNFIDEVFVPQTVAHGMGPNGTDLIGAEPFKQAHQIFCEAFPDLYITIDAMVCDGDKVASHLVCQGTHSGDSLGIAATGKPVEFRAMTIARIEDGKIVEGWNIIDLLPVFQQAGGASVSEKLP